MTVFLPGVFRSPMSDSQHWTKHARWVKDQKHRTEMAILAEVGRRHGVTASAPKVVTFRLCSTGEWDDDNLRAACKPARDALKSMGLIDDDRPSAGHRFDYEWVLATKKTGIPKGLWITVTPMTGGAGEEG